MEEERKLALKYIKTAKGQMEASMKMIEEDRYCVDISHQLLATIALIKKANQEILKGHMRGCVHDAILGKDEEKIEEVLMLVDKMTK